MSRVGGLVMRRGVMRHGLLILAALLAAIPVLALAAAWLLLDGEALRPRLVAALERATGQTVRLERLELRAFSFAPSAVAEGLALGAAEQPLAALRRAEVSLALLPLLAGRVELRRVAAEGVEVRAAAPRAEPPAPAPPAAGALPPAAAARRQLALGEVLLTDVTLHLGAGTFRLPSARVAPDGALAASLVVVGQAIAIAGSLPPGLLGDGAFALRAALPGDAALAVAGERRGAAVSGRAEAAIPALAALSPLVGAALPALERVAASAEFAWEGGAPRLTRAEATAGPSRLGRFELAELRASAAGEAPMRFEGRGGAGGAVGLAGTGPSLPALLGGAALPVDLALSLPGGEARIRGTLPVPGRPGGALEASGRIADPGPLGAPPGLRWLRFAGRAEPEAAGWRLAGLIAEAAAGDVAADLLLRLAPRLGVSGRVTSGRLDLDALRPAVGEAAAAFAPAGEPPAPPPAAAARVIPDTKLPLAALRGFDADLTFALGELQAGGQAIRAVAGRFVNEDGRARLDPFLATPPGGRVSLRAAADATLAMPAVQVAGGGEGLDLAALLPAAGIAGRADLAFDLRGQGETLRAVAATLTGRLGLAVAEGALGAELSRWLLAGLPQGLPPGLAAAPREGGLALACLALLAEAERGVARPGVALLDTALGRLGATGQVDLGAEALALRLATDLRLGSLRVRAPVPLTGTLAAPRLDWSQAAQSALSGELGQQAERLLPGLGQALRPGAALALPPAMPECAPALAAARFGRAGPVPRQASAAPPPTAASPAAPPGVDQVLRGLLGR